MCITNYASDLERQLAIKPKVSAPRGGLCWRDRPSSIQDRIDIVFKELSSNPLSVWGMYNGSETYGLCSVNAYDLVVKRIQGAPPQQQEFAVMDVGAGNFQWGQGLAKYVAENKSIKRKFTLRIISVRGEGSPKPEITEVVRGIFVYNLGGFKVENLSRELRIRELNFHVGSFDLIVSHWCFRHLVDPLGTFVQTYNLLRPYTGCLLMDGFFFRTQYHTDLDYADNAVLQLLVDTGAPFLVVNNSSAHDFRSFILRRPHHLPCTLQMQYDGMQTTVTDSDRQIGSKTVTRFKRQGGPLEAINYTPFFKMMRGVKPFVGDPEVFQWLAGQGLFGKHDTDYLWIPLLSAYKNIKPIELEGTPYPDAS